MKNKGTIEYLRDLRFKQRTKWYEIQQQIKKKQERIIQIKKDISVLEDRRNKHDPSGISGHIGMMERSGCDNYHCTDEFIYFRKGKQEYELKDGKLIPKKVD